MSNLAQFKKNNFGFLRLSKIVDHFCVHSFNNDRKYFPNLLRIAEFTWKQIYWNDLRVPRNKLLLVDKSNNTVQIPADSLRIVGISVLDNCNHWQPLYVDEFYNTMETPKASTCGCNKCNCDSELCMVMSNIEHTEEQYVMNGQTFTRIINTKVCPNGELIKEITEVFLTENNVVADLFQLRTRIERVDVLEIKPCGCVDNTPANWKKCSEACGHPFLQNKHHKCCQPTTIPLGKPLRGRYVIDEDLGVIHILDCDTDKVLVTHISNGEECGEELMIPEYAEETVLTGLYWRSIRFRNNVSGGEKMGAKIEHISAVQDLIEFLNPIVPHEFLDLQNREFKW
jgi:hypothetical protein